MADVQMMEVATRPMLRRLAARLGIVDSYVDQTGGSVRVTTDETRERLLAAMGHDASTEEIARETLLKLRRGERRGLINPVRVVRQRSRTLARVMVRVPAMQGDVQWTLVLRTEEGDEHRWQGMTHGGPARRTELALPIVPPLGYHELHICFEGAGKEKHARQRLIVVPSRCAAPEARLGGKRGFGITANLYTIRSESNWGAGDVGDIASIAAWLGDHGGAFVGMNPLHALRNAGYDVSPYSPITRLFRNPLYIRVTDIPELAHNANARAHIAAPEFQESLAALRKTPLVEYARVMALRAPVLQSLHRTFREHEADTPRAHAYRAYVKREDPQLTQFATYMAISELEGPDARQWPEPLRDSSSDAVRAMREQEEERVEYHRWLQFELDRQLGVAEQEAVKAGLSLGMYTDLAVGSSASGSDVWANPRLFLQDATVGAPPDMYSDEGQNWGLPAIDPHELRRTGYDYWMRLLRAGFRHAGALRIDHALGLFRMFWVPLGASAKEGAYVRSFAHELFGILALESVRHNALVVGEDLGTVPPGVPEVLAKWGVLSSKVQVFEREFHSGRYRPASEYQRMALATVNTHDLPPLVGWAQARDIQIRSEVGDLADIHVSAQMHASRGHERSALIASLIDAGLLPQHSHDHLPQDDLIAAVHSFIRRTPSVLVGLSFDDLAVEAAPVNIPGVWQDKYPSWSRRMQENLETILADPRTVLRLGLP